MAGSGPKTEEIRRRIREADLGGRLTVSSLAADYEALLSTIDVFVSPRRRDWFGAPILAAQAAGLPVVATGVGAAFALVTEGVDGHLVPAADPASLAAGIESVVADPDAALGLGREARRMVRDRRTAAAAAERTEIVYREVLEDGG